MRILAAFLLLLVAGGDARADTLRVTTESPEYCNELLSRISLLPKPLVEPSRSLAVEGRTLCNSGHVRTGVAKLRRALRAAQAP